MASKYTQGLIYITNLLTLETIEAQYVPMSLVGNRVAKLAEVAIPSKNTPNFHFTGGSEEITLKLDFFAEDITRTEVISKVSQLKALTIKDGKNNPAPKVKVVFGDIFQDERWVVKNVRYEFSLFNNFFNMNPNMCIVDLTLALAPEKDLTLRDVLR